MILTVTQVQNVLRTYQKQVREERVKAILGVGEEPSRWKDRLDISREGRNRLGGDPPSRQDPSNRSL
ncbi:MAG: hypothetical protein OHK0028_09010 [Deltaproteobacteria bacterium]